MSENVLLITTVSLIIIVSPFNIKLSEFFNKIVIKDESIKFAITKVSPVIVALVTSG